MDAKEKAKQLIDKFLGFEIVDYKDAEMRLTIYKAKKNALIAVDEILETNLLQTDYFYWKLVKSEIEKF